MSSIIYHSVALHLAHVGCGAVLNTARPLDIELAGSCPSPEPKNAELLPVKWAITSVVTFLQQLHNPKVEILQKTSMLKLKTVSGRLRALFRGRESTVNDRVEPGSRNLLVVDDEESICFSMSEYFSQHGFKVDTAHEIEEAESLIKETEYRVIIQDLRLGLTLQPDGIEIIKFVQKRSPETRIVVLTSYGSPEAEAEARRAGADAFLRKPKPLSQVAQVVQGLIESPRTRIVRA